MNRQYSSRTVIECNRTVKVASEGAKSRAEDATKALATGLRSSGGKSGDSASESGRDGDEDGGGAHFCCVGFVVVWMD